MTTLEELAWLTRIAQRFAAMDRTNPIQVESYPHRQEGDFYEGQIAWEVSAYVGKRLCCVSKTLPEAIHGACEEMRKFLRQQADRAEADSKRLAEEAAASRILAD